jgi:hypothetical protein
MSIGLVKHVCAVAGLLGALEVAAATIAEARPTRPARRAPASGAFRLFAAPTMGFEVNRIYCGIRAIGETCVDITGSPVLGGGSWPRGSGDQYIFNSGLQIAGIVDPAAGFEWAGDTTGTWFMDPRGDQQSGEGITDIYNSLDLTDAANWPSAAFVKDPTLYHPTLLGRATISQQDIWWRYWDGNPNQTTGRPHPAGILVEQRGMGWNFPSGNEDIIYFIYRFINITASDPSAYSGLASAGYSQAEIDEIAAIGANFQRLNEAKFNVDIPDQGYTLTNVFAAFFMDPDVGDFLTNYSTAVLPFALGVAYVGDFDEPNWLFPSDIFSPPFAAAPGFVGVKYLKSPVNPATGDEFGITIFSNTSNGPPFPDAVGIEQTYRFLSGTVSTALGDNSCTVTDPPGRHLCALVQVQSDTRFFESSGPFTLAPGEQSVIVTAFVFAAPLASAIQGFIGGDMKPGIPPSGPRLVTGVDTLRDIDRAVGWVSHSNLNGDTTITQNEVVTADRSLLGKALVAQAVFDNLFLLPFAPEAPNFFLVPGSNEVTVVWERSPTEQVGDPYFAVASQPLQPDGVTPNPLYDPNYRELDVEGYRIWRGRTASQMEVVAQFDYDNTVFLDYNGSVFNTDYGTQCAPELGLTISCPAFPHAVPIATQTGFQPGLVQVPPGGRVETQTTDPTRGNVIITLADTAVSGGLHCLGQRCPNLTDTGVPFAFVDRSVRNGFRYFYAVTAFDVNSVRSVGVGNTSLESPLITRPVTPRSTAANRIPAGPVTADLVGEDGTVLDPAAAPPTIDASGRFSGPQPPTERFLFLGATVFADQLVLNGGQVDIRIDSIVPLWYHTATYYTSVIGAFPGATGFGPAGPLGEEDGTVVFGPIQTSLEADSLLADSLGLQRLPFAGQALAQVTLGAVTFGSKDADWHPDVDGSFFGFAGITDVGGSRWFEGANETMGDPTLGLAHGQLTGVTVIYRPVRIRNASALFRRFDQTSYHLFRAADIQVYWGSTPGTVDSVVDITHRVRVPFDPQNRASYGFRNDVTGTSAGSAPNGVVTFNDFLYGACLPGAAGITQTGCDDRDYLAAAALENVDVTGDGVSDGTGFGMYINGEPFIFQTAALPSNTVWTYRSYFGLVDNATGSYVFTPRPRNPSVTGLTLRITAGAPAQYPPTAATDLSRVHTVPDPYYVTNPLEISASTKILRFVNLPTQAIIRIYSTSGILVNVITHNDPSGGDATWNLRNRNNQFVASGVYFYHVETPSGQAKVGRFTVVNFAQ